MKQTRRLLSSLLAPTGLELADAVRLTRNLSDIKAENNCSPRLQPMKDTRIYAMGLRELLAREQSVSFRHAVDAYREERTPRCAERTNRERRQVFNRLMHAAPQWAEAPIRSWTAERCRTVIRDACPTAHGRSKAYRQLHALFRFALRQGWCSENPMQRILPEAVTETEMAILSLAQIRQLLTRTLTLGYLPCAPAVGLMLWAGIRPTEVARLCWGDLDLDEGIAYLRAKHTKTGGPRQVTLQPVLLAWLRKYRPGTAEASTPITPPGWVRCWRDLRLEAGLYPWRPDTLRHTFASFHLKRFRDLEQLRLEMGHTDLRQLRTRYLNMRGITARDAAAFWQGRFGESTRGEPDHM